MGAPADGPDLLIGLSTHTRDEFDTASEDADYLCTGPVYATPTKPGRPATGLELVVHAAGRERDGEEVRPWFAIGGIDPTSLPEVLEAGARRVVVVRAVADADDPPAAARLLISVLKGVPRFLTIT